MPSLRRLACRGEQVPKEDRESLRSHMNRLTMKCPCRARNYLGLQGMAVLRTVEVLRGHVNVITHRRGKRGKEEGKPPGWREGTSPEKQRQKAIGEPPR